MDINNLLELSGSINENILFINNLYMNFDRRAEKFASENGIECPAGCGNCCRNYEPEISYAEALFAAAWIIKSNAGLSSYFAGIKQRNYCIFFDSENESHCRIYPARPFLCRAFAFSGVKDKNGNHKYKSCKSMDVKKELYGDFIPLMTEEGMRILYSNADMKTPEPLSEAVEKAWQKLSFLILITGFEGNPGFVPMVSS